MENKTTFNFYYKIKALLPAEEFKHVNHILSKESNNKLEAFWNIIIAGYPVEFALSNYAKLYEYLKDKPIVYSEALTTYSVYPKLKSGIYVRKTKWYELN